MQLICYVLSAGIPYASHETDLYIPANEKTRKILAEFPTCDANKTTFQNQVEGGTWFDIPFAYLPAWEAKEKRPKLDKDTVREGDYVRLTDGTIARVARGWHGLDAAWLVVTYKRDNTPCERSVELSDIREKALVPEPTIQ